MANISDIVQDYLKKGFGSMNKNDFEVWIFHYLLKENGYASKSDNQISRELKIPESKVKRLRYEADLVYPKDEESFKNEFYEVLKNRVYKQVGDNKIQFVIRDKNLRLYLNDKLESFGSFADSSFNTDIVTVTAQDLVLLISDFEGKKEIFQRVKSQVEKNTDTTINNMGHPQVLAAKYAKEIKEFLKIIGPFAPGIVDLIRLALQISGLLDK
jgi:hypothetical protein